MGKGVEMRTNYVLLTAHSVTYGTDGNLFDLDSDEAILHLLDNSTYHFERLPVELAYKFICSKNIRFTVQTNVGAWK